MYRRTGRGGQPQTGLWRVALARVSHTQLSRVQVQRMGILLLCLGAAAILSFTGDSIVSASGQTQTEPAQLDPDTLAPAPAAVFNGMFECEQFVPDGAGRRLPAGWILARAVGEPEINSARHQFAGGCEGSGHVERMEGNDAIAIISRDIETPPLPGKPFDVVFYQQVTVAPGGDYSVSGWMLSLCGGSAVPNDCPEGVYIRKAIGLDPTGGTDPDSPDIVWTENLDNFITREQVRVGWSNLRIGARAESSQMTVFLRVHSPFQWHGAHAFIDAIHLARAPVAWFVNFPRTLAAGVTVPVRWSSFQSPEIAAIPGGTHVVLVDIQARARVGTGEYGPWRDILVDGTAEGQCAFAGEQAGTTVQMRLRARAEQPPPPAPGAWPNQRFPGPWSEPSTMRVQGSASPPPAMRPELAEHALYVPALGRMPAPTLAACSN